MPLPPLYLSTETTKEVQRLSLRQYWKPLLKVVCWAGAAVIVLFLDISTIVSVVGCLIALGFIAWGIYPLTKRSLPPVMGVEATSTSRRPEPVLDKTEGEDAEVALAGEGLEEEVLPEADADEVVETLYNERSHVLDLLVKIRPALVAVIVAICMVVLGELRYSYGWVIGTLIAVGLLAGFYVWKVPYKDVEKPGEESKLKDKFMYWVFTARNMVRQIAFVLVTFILATLVSFTSPDAWRIVVGLLLLYAGMSGLRRAAKWYLTRNIVTTRQLMIHFAPPAWLLMKDSDHSLAISKIETIKAEQNPFEKVFSLNCGTLSADAAGDQDAVFHKIKRLRNFSGIQEVAARIREQAESD